MKRILQFLLMLTICFSAYSQAVTYNAIATAYVTTTISQNVVFNSTMQQGGTFTFSVLAHNGGGRAGQSDTANVKIEFYTSTGTLVTSANSTYNANLPNPNAVCGNPCIDTSVPWSTLTISKTLTGAEAATVSYARVSMYGVDGSFWAGDYGPWYRAPTFQLDGGGNLTYNPEFGPYNNITAQGWTSSPGFGACQGAWGGSNACIVNSDGVPGTSTVGLVANANGGGPSATGGTTSGTPGGYNSTMSTTNAGTGATAGAPPAPTVTSTTTSYTYRTVVTGNTTRVYRTPVTTTNYSDNTSTTSSGTEELYYTAVVTTSETNGIVGGNLATTITTTTTTTYSNGTQTVSSSDSYVYYGTINQTNAPGNQIVTSGGSSSAGPTTEQQTRYNTWNNGSQASDNYLYIDQISGDYNTVNVTQSGTKNTMSLGINGGSNTINAEQTGVNYLNALVQGSSNTVTSLQSNTAGSNYQETKIMSGNNNTINVSQKDNGNNLMFNTITGNNNSISAVQEGGGNHYLENKLIGNGNSVLANQSGAAGNKANIELTNAGGPASVDLQQSGGKSFTIIQGCANPAGCTTVIRQ